MPAKDSERRQFDRFETDVKINFSVNFDIQTKVEFQLKNEEMTGSGQKKYSAISHNISAEGLALRTVHKLSAGDILDMEVFVPTSQQPVRMEGQVRWCRSAAQGVDKDDAGEGFDVGICVSSVEGRDVSSTIIIDPQYHLAWSIVLESVFGDFKKLMLQRKLPRGN